MDIPRPAAVGGCRRENIRSHRGRQHGHHRAIAASDRDAGRHRTDVAAPARNLAGVGLAELDHSGAWIQA